MQKENIAVIFGGKSTEHDISIITGLQVFANVDRDKYNIVPIYIFRNGKMFTGKNLSEVEAYVDFKEFSNKIKRVSFCPEDNFLYLSKNNKDDKKNNFKAFLKINCAILCCHGINGEDGTLQGLLELSNIPYTSSGVLSSAISMDKIIMKDIFVANKIETVKYSFFNKDEYFLNSEDILNDLENKINYPMFVKPANLGSSIGISKCKDRETLDEAIGIASCYDSRILVEEGIEDKIEVNCAVFGNFDSQVVSSVEYPKSWSDFLSFDEKYIQREKGTGNNEKRAEKTTDNKLAGETEEKIRELSAKIFKIFNCKGVVRIDFLFDKITKNIYVNELNSIPGSLAFYLFKDQGYDFKTILNKIIEIAKKEKENKSKNKYSFTSQALINFGGNRKLK